MAFRREGSDKAQATAWSRDYSADSVLQDLLQGNTDSFSDKPEFINYYSGSDWKVYKVTVTIEPATDDS